MTDNELHFIINSIQEGIEEIEALSYYEQLADGHPGTTDGVLDNLNRSKELLGEELE